MSGITRRAYLDLNTKEERMIHDAIQAIEELGAHVKLTDAVVKLAEAKECLSDYIDERLETTDFKINQPIVQDFNIQPVYNPVFGGN